MSLWRSVRGEMAGAWRSICYDLGRRPAGRDTGPDVTSTGLNTFPGSLVDLPAGPPERDARPPRRFVAVAALCALTGCGAAGSYLVATTAFAGRMSDTTVVAAAPEQPGTADRAADGGTVGMGRIPQTPRRQATPAAPAAGTAGTGAAAVAAPGGPAGGVVAPPRAAARPPARTGPTGTTGGTAGVPAEPECHCETPPVPTPTAASEPSAPAPVSVSPSPSGSPSPSASASLSPAPEATAPGADGDRPHRRPHP